MDDKRQRLVLVILLGVAVLLPVGIGFLFFFARIFAMLGDPGSGTFLVGCAMILSLLWFVDFVGLVFALAFRTLFAKDGESE